MLTGKGVIAWRHVLTSLAPAPAAAGPPANSAALLPADLAAGLVSALAGLVLGGR